MCKTTNCLKIDCKFCSLPFCTYCLLPEKHLCANLMNCKNESKTKLAAELEKNRCVAKKIKLI